MVKSHILKFVYLYVITLFFIISGVFYFSPRLGAEDLTLLHRPINNPPQEPFLYPLSFRLSLAERGESVTKYDHLIRAASRKYSLDPALVKAVIHAESRFDPQALSPKGAMGLMQLDPVTVKELKITDPFNPKYNIYGGVRYLRGLLDIFEGDKHLALAAYNAGPNRVHQHRGVPPFKDTKKYLTRVLRYLDYYKLTSLG
ncbi:MAG: lytic transglycosylase domain-containing protein [Deltaproteobacteria bacterium]|nr:lytic transglycosylase domain-containing protein [Deltaproteobacteria bacterium]